MDRAQRTHQQAIEKTRRVGVGRGIRCTYIEWLRCLSSQGFGWFASFFHVPPRCALFSFLYVVAYCLCRTDHRRNKFYVLYLLSKGSIVASRPERSLFVIGALSGRVPRLERLVYPLPLLR